MFKYIYHAITSPYYMWKINTFLFNYVYDENLDIIINKVIKKMNEDVDGITITIKNCTCNISYGDVVIEDLWMSNKYYAWLSGGTIIKNYKIIYSWDSRRPAVKTLYDFNKALNKKLKKEIDKKVEEYICAENY